MIPPAVPQGEAALETLLAAGGVRSALLLKGAFTDRERGIAQEAYAAGLEHGAESARVQNRVAAIFSPEQSNGNTPEPIFQDPGESTNFIPWTGPPRLPCEKRYRAIESPRCQSTSKTGLCQFGNHAMEIGAAISVMHVIDLETGKSTEIWGCQECAEKLS